MSLTENYKEVLAGLPDNKVTLVAVSKTHPAEKIAKLYGAGCRDFGENKVQELCEKTPLLPKDIRWHLIGHLQTNKVKQIAGFVYLIHSVDSLKLLAEINKQGQKHGRTIDCLLELFIAKEETKFGLEQEEALALLSSPEYKAMQNIRIVGLMGMASQTDDTDQVRDEFRSLKMFFDRLKHDFFLKDDHFKVLSMGMSGDYKIAVDEGSTMVRVGSAIFGERTHIA